MFNASGRLFSFRFDLNPEWRGAVGAVGAGEAGEAGGGKKR